MLLSRNSECKGKKRFWVLSYELWVICWHEGCFFKCSHNVTHNSSLVTHNSSFSRVFPGVSQQNGEYGACSHAEGVIQVSDDADGWNAGKSGGYQHLRSVGDDSLHEAWEGVQYAGCFPAVQVEAEGDVLGYGAGGDDGNGVVGGAEIGDAD